MPQLIMVTVDIGSGRTTQRLINPDHIVTVLVGERGKLTLTMTQGPLVPLASDWDLRRLGQHVPMVVGDPLEGPSAAAEGAGLQPRRGAGAANLRASRREEDD